MHAELKANIAMVCTGYRKLAQRVNSRTTIHVVLTLVVGCVILGLRHIDTG